MRQNSYYTSYPSSYSVPTPAKNHRRRGATSLEIGLLIGLALLAAPIVVIAGLIFYIQAAGLILPGVTAASVPLAWMDREQAAQKLNSINETSTLLVTDGTRTWETTPAFFGIWLDPGATTEAAYAAGRSNGGPAALLGELAKGRGYDVQPVVTVNAAFAQDQLNRWAAQINEPAQDATLSLEGDRVVVQGGRSGSAVDVRQSLLLLLADPVGIMQKGRLRLVVTPVQPAVLDVAPIQAQVDALMSHTLKLTAYDPITDERLDWTAPRATVASWLVLENSSAGPHVSLDPQKVSAYAASLPSELDGDRTLGPLPDPVALLAAVTADQPVVLTVKHPASQYIVQSGDTLLKIGWKVGMPYWRIIKANPGLTADTPLSAGRSLIIPSKDELLPLPVVPNKRIIISISQQRMWVKQDGNVIHEYVISTGIDRSPTQPGIFQVQTHEINAYAAVWDLTMPHFLGIYEAWPGFMNGIHGLPTLSNGVRLWGSILGKPASYGCIILDLDAAGTLYYWADAGTVVEIQP